jgi:hypothetical protein
MHWHGRCPHFFGSLLIIPFPFCSRVNQRRQHQLSRLSLPASAADYCPRTLVSKNRIKEAADFEEIPDEGACIQLKVLDASRYCLQTHHDAIQ